MTLRINPGERCMAKQSAGLLLYRRRQESLQVFLVHPGGPFWAKKDDGAWSIPKGEFTSEPPLDAAQRELTEETGFNVSGPFMELTPIKQKGGNGSTHGPMQPTSIRPCFKAIPSLSDHANTLKWTGPPSSPLRPRWRK